MMKKKMVALLLSLVMLFSLVPVTAVAEGSNLSMTVTYPEGRTADTLQEGDTVTLSVSNNDMTVSSFTFNVSFDKEKFECVSIVGTGKNPNKYYLTDSYDETVAAQASSDVSGANSTGSVGFGWSASEDAAYVAGKIVTITFEAKDIGSADFTLNEDSSGQDGYKDTVSTASVTVLKTPMAAASATVDAPTKGNAFPTAVTIPENAAYSASVAWFTDADCTTSAGNIALGGQTYYAQITLTPDTANGESFASSVAVTGSATGDYTPTSGNLVLTVPFTTPQRMITDLAVTTATQSYYVGEDFDTATLVVKAIYDDGTTDDDYKAYTVQGGTDLAYGTYPVTIVSNDDSKVTTATDITVSKKDLPTDSISITPTELTYNGSDQKGNVTVVINGIAEGLTGALEIIYKIGNSKAEEIKDAGTYDVYASTVGGTMYNPLEQTKVGTVKINKANVTLNAPTAKELTYDGTAQALVTAGTATGGELQYSTDGVNYSTTVPTAKDAGTYTVYYKVVGDDNHKDIKPVDVSVIIDPKAVTVTANDASKTFGQSDPVLSATVTGLVEGENESLITYTLGRDQGDNVGTYDITASGNESQGNYTVTFVKGTFTITKANASVTAPATKTDLTYNGQDQALIDAGTTTGGTMQYKLGADGTYSTAIPEATDAGTYTVYYKVVGNDNYYDVAESSVTVSIKKQPVDVSKLEWQNTNSFNYDAQAKTVSLGSAIPQGLTAKYQNNTATYVGEYTATVSFTADDNHEVSGTPATFTWNINPVSNPITVTKDSYNLAKGGNTLDLNTLIKDAKGTVTFSVNSGDAATLDGSVLASGADSSETPVVINIHIDAVDENNDGKAEYNAYDKDSAIAVTVVNKAQKELTVTMGGWTYGDNAKSPAFTAPAGSANPVITYNASSTAPTNAGTYTVQVVCETATEIYTGTAEFKIAPRTAAITWSDTSFTYDGENHVPTATVSNKVGQDSVSVTVIGAASDAGSHTATATGLSGLSSANYVLPDGAACDFTINKLVAELEWKDTTFTYDGQSHVPTATVKNAVGDDTVTVTVTGEKTAAGSYTATATGLDSANYKLPNAKTQSFTINKLVAELEWSNTSFTYDGQRHVPTATVKNAVGNDTVTVTVTGGQTNAGSYTATATKVSNSNYALSDGAACDFTIEPKNISDMTVNLSAAALTYNGKAQTKAVASVKVGNTTLSSGRDYTVTGATQTKAGHYELTVTGTGNYAGSKTVAWEIAPKAVTVTANNANKVYGAEDPALTAKVSGTVGSDTVEYTVSRDEGNDAGTYAITPDGAENQGNYTVTFKTGTFTITKANASVTSAPQAVTGLKFNGQARELVTAGQAEGGELQYKLGNGAYGTGIPEATEAGTYTVYYKVVGDANHNNVSEARITVTIAPLSGNEVVTSGDDVTASTQPDDTINNQLSELEQYSDDKLDLPENPTDDDKAAARQEAVKKAMAAEAKTTAANTSDLYYVVNTGSSAAKVTFALPVSAATHNFKVMYMDASGNIVPVDEAKVTASGIEVPVAADGDGVYLVTYTNKPVHLVDDSASASGDQSIITDLTDINKVTVDGKTVNPKYYTVSGGVVTLSEAYLRTLSNGKHTVRVENAKYISTAVITVSNAAVKSAGTGDAGLGLYAMLALSSVTGAAWLGLKKRKED